MRASQAVMGWVLAGLVLVLTIGNGCRGGAGACHDDNPPVSSMFYEGGSSCTLPDGRPGLGDGQFGCIDPTACHCRAEGGPADCAAGAVCVYHGCSAAIPGTACVLPGGGQGTCCDGACSAVDLSADPSNCGGCGNVCPDGIPCDGGLCRFPAGTTTVACPSGLVAAEATSVSGTSPAVACVAVSCAGLSDGAPCSLQPDGGVAVNGHSGADPMAGLCCQGICVIWYRDDSNCGGCGVTCCPGTRCGVSNPNPYSAARGIGAWCI